jgi:16S rRNA (cytosine967-C5)-methyltransferase
MNNARAVAIEILNKVQQEHYTLDHWLDAYAEHLDRMGPSDRALSHALVLGVTRWQGRLDWIIDQMVEKNKKIDPPIRNILRMGLFQLFHLDRIPKSAAVHTAVELVKKYRKPWATGFVNGMLRRALEAADRLPWPDPSVNPVDYLSITQSFPKWMIERWIPRWGFSETELFCRTVNRVPTVTVRTNTLKITRRNLLDTLSRDHFKVKPSRFAPEGIDIIESPKPIMRMPVFADGLFQIQDQGSQLVSLAAAVKPGHRVWDACAGLGTKTAHMAQLMKNHGFILASDSRSTKLARLGAEMQRLGIRIVQSRKIDLECDPLDPDMFGFDRILVDAPCSGTGVIQKNPDTKWRLKPQDYKRYGARQVEFLERLSRYVKVGGTIVYAVCSNEPEENADVITGFLQKHTNFAIQQPEITAILDVHRLLTPEGFLFTLPHRHAMDGFFAAVLKKHSGDNRIGIGFFTP